MTILNIHKRQLNCQKADVLKLYETLSRKEDKMWPLENWPRMIFANGLQVGAEGGHGPIHYKVIKLDSDGTIEFEFQRPRGFYGTHKFQSQSLSSSTTEIIHTIAIETKGMGTLKWIVAIRSLHDALIEDAFDKIENQLTGTTKKTTWSLWVRILRTILGAKSTTKGSF